MIHFQNYQEISAIINNGDLETARREVIKLLNLRKKEKLPYNPILNHLIREVGLYPYMDCESSDWLDVFASNLFRADIGGQKSSTLHLEQAHILRRLLQGESIAVSAPTSFGKSYIIDAYIAMRNPKCVVIIVPTVALANETRRRLAHKFSNTYKIITTTGEEISGRDIFVFPQERAFAYTELITEIDLLIVDEFYKAGLDDERANRLVNAIVELGKIAKQRYFLGPNIDNIQDNPITAGMSFIKEDFQTVVTNVAHIYRKRQPNEDVDAFKSRTLSNLIFRLDSKSLIYAGSHSQVDKVREILTTSIPLSPNNLCKEFAIWLRQNYGTQCDLIPLISRGIGVHNGNLHRSLAQLQIKLFEEKDGLKTIISTSSIIEGVNTQAENVILWNCKISNKELDYFTYRNIIGRAGRMFKYFIGYVYLLEKAPEKEHTNLELPLTDEVICNLDDSNPGVVLNSKQKNRILEYNQELLNILGQEAYSMVRNSPIIKGSSPALVLKLAKLIRQNYNWPRNYNSLTQNNTYNWRTPVKDVLEAAFGTQPSNRLLIALWAFSNNWYSSIPEISRIFTKYNVPLDKYFSLERDVNFKIPMVFSIVNVLKNALYPNAEDISGFIKKVSTLFLPKNVYELEEYGLPRMISKKISERNLIDLENDDIPLSIIVENLKNIGCENLIEKLGDLTKMDKYIIRYFYEGI